MTTKTFDELYLELELFGNTLYYKEEDIYKMRIEAETDPKRQREMSSYLIRAGEVGNMTGIVWTMHDLYRAKKNQDMEALDEVRQSFNNYADLQLKKLVELKKTKAEI